jgi:hypothetical protein
MRIKQMQKKLYNVKIDLTVWYDRNFEIEATCEDEARNIAHDIAREQTTHLIGVDIDVENDGGWTYGDQDYSTAHVELEEIIND